MKAGRKLKAFTGLALSLFVICVFIANIAGAAGGDETQQCLECHSKQGIVIHFRNGESELAAINARQFRLSAHGSISCSSCHTDFSAKSHPTRIFKSSKLYRIHLSRTCRHCHADSQLQSRPVHMALLEKELEGTPLPCTDCHNAHAMTPAAGGKLLKSESDYCMKCHTRRLKMIFNNDETVSLAVDESYLRGSVHNELSCSDCHFGFSSKEHPERTFRTRRDYAIASSQTCRRCHFDKYSETLESIHFAQLNQGNLKAPVCTDCHGSHSIQKGRTEKLLSAKRCEKCHQVIFRTYAASVHGKALIDENNHDVPICVDCHRAHDVSNPLTLEFRENIPEMCGNCHANKEIVGKYGLSTEVLKTYLSDFHGITLNFYKQQKDKLMTPGRPIAVCTDCHGTHDIKATESRDTVIIKKNLARQCRKCHPEANLGFPNAWLSHYEPSLHKAPLIYVIKLACKAFLILMAIGIPLQILLHLWRYASNR
jgi:predicted CXXCH cytochrome family protein